MVVIGGGTAGLVSAAGAAGLGAKVALIERNLLGGDCLNVGCVPSKGVIRAARAAHDARNGAEFGVHHAGEPQIDFAAAMERMRRLRAGISEHDSAERFRKLGVDVFIGNGRFVDPNSIEVDGKRLRFDRAVIATGARAAEPPIAGLARNRLLHQRNDFHAHRITAPAGRHRRRSHRLRAGAEFSTLRQPSDLAHRRRGDPAARRSRCGGGGP